MEVLPQIFEIIYSLSFQSGNVTSRRKVIVLFYIFIFCFLPCFTAVAIIMIPPCWLMVTEASHWALLPAALEVSGIFLGPPKHLNIVNATQFIF